MKLKRMLMSTVAAASLFGFGFGNFAHAATFHPASNPGTASITISTSNTDSSPAYATGGEISKDELWGYYVPAVPYHPAEFILDGIYTGDVTDGEKLTVFDDDKGTFTLTIHTKISSTTPTTTPTLKVLYTGYLTSDHAVRSGPSTKYKVIANLKKGSAVSVVKTGSWYTIKYNGKQAYVYGDISKTQPVLYTAYLTASHAVRTGAGTKYKSVKTLKAGSAVSVVSTGTWDKIKYSGAYRYVWGADVKKPVSTSKLTATHAFRTGPSTKYHNMKNLKKGTKVTVLSKGTWDKVVYSGQIGYVWGKDVK